MPSSAGGSTSCGRPKSAESPRPRGTWRRTSGAQTCRLWTAIYPSGFQPYRDSHFDVRYWVEAGYPAEFAEAYLASQSASYNHPNSAIEPRIPAIFDYYIAAEEEVALAVAGKKTVPEALESAAARWEEITDRNGRARQIALYQAALDL